METYAGTRLKVRIGSVLAAGIAIFAIAVAISVIPQSVASQTRTQAQMPQWQIDAGGTAKFDVASVKQNTSVPSQQTLHTNVVLDQTDIFTPTGGLFSATDEPLINYILFAYKLTSYQIVTLMAHLPNWASIGGYDVEARVSGNPTKDQFRFMIQSLLADRFKLAFHYETRQLPVMMLVLDKPGKLGPHLRPHSEPPLCTSEVVRPATEPPTIPGGFPEPCGAFMFCAEAGRYHGAGRNITMGMMAPYLTELGNGIDRPILDDTRLNGEYDLVFEWTPQFSGPNFQPDPTGPTFLEALKDQLGLKLEPKTGPEDVVVIDRVEQPSPN